MRGKNKKKNQDHEVVYCECDAAYVHEPHVKPFGDRDQYGDYVIVTCLGQCEAPKLSPGPVLCFNPERHKKHYVDSWLPTGVEPISYECVGRAKKEPFATTSFPILNVNKDGYRSFAEQRALFDESNEKKEPENREAGVWGFVDTYKLNYFVGHAASYIAHSTEDGANAAEDLRAAAKLLAKQIEIEDRIRREKGFTPYNNQIDFIQNIIQLEEKMLAESVYTHKKFGETKDV